MSDTDDRIPETFVGPDGIEYVRVHSIKIGGAFMQFMGYCPQHCSEGGYVPHFPFFLNGKPQPGFHCGACLTQWINQARQDPAIDVQDYRWVLYN